MTSFWIRRVCRGNGPALLVILAAAALAVGGTRDWAGGWNDASRLAAVECLGDHHTWQIDQSIYLRTPAGTAVNELPSAATDGLVRTKDRLFIAGHYYSDKPPVPALLMAGLYQVWKGCTGSRACERPANFVYWMTLGSSGLAYVVAVYCIFQLGQTLRLPLAQSLLLTASFGLCTVAPVYARQVNGHILLLAVASALFLCLLRMTLVLRTGRIPWLLVLAAGSLAGLGYTIDLGAGPVLLVCTLGLVGYRCRQGSAVLLAGLAVLPWFLLHHALNYAVGGTFQPANAVADYFNWPGSPFSGRNLTGSWNHPSVGHFLVYAASLLVGRQGFLDHNLPLFLAFAAGAGLLWRRVTELPELLMGVSWSAGTWLLYALTSTNHAGLCCSVRWLVPMLAPGYYVLAVLLRDCPRYRNDFRILCGGGALLTVQLWLGGPWAQPSLRIYWLIQGACLVGWLGYRLCGLRSNSRPMNATTALDRPGLSRPNVVFIRWRLPADDGRTTSDRQQRELAGPLETLAATTTTSPAIPEPGPLTTRRPSSHSD